jgi:GGDEF domain-containing protein
LEAYAHHYELTSLRGRRRFGGQLDRRWRRLRRGCRLLLGGSEEVGGVVVVDVSKEIELVPRRHFRLL